MRTRSTRFFVILLHLVGCRPRNLYNLHQGIVGVQPWPIVLEKLDLSRMFQDDEDEEGLNAVRNMDQEEAVWLQNEQGKCLGPTARFTDCGDAALWFIVKRKLPRRRRLLQMGLLEADEDTSLPPTQAKEGLAFYLVDRDVEGGTPRVSPNAEHKKVQEVASETNSEKKAWWRRILRRKKQPKMECLTYDERGRISVQACTRKVSWAWEMDSQGVTRAVSPSSADHCLVKSESGVALGSCRQTSESVNLSVVRYRAVSLPDALQHLSKGKEEASSWLFSAAKESESPKVPEEKGDETNESKTTLPLRQKDLAHFHASKPSRQPSLKNSSKPSLAQSRETRRQQARALPSPLRILHGANPINTLDMNFPKSSKIQASSSRTTTPTAAAPTVPHRTRKIPVHPYIAASKNEIWTDPQTSLQYPTDLSGYLNMDRKEKGRHTIMGVGQYRKGYVIKVYGIAFYVSKRDVLADPFFADYARMTADELKKRPEFYEHLRTTDDNFDRTIIIKINMQLAAETIRSSLHADWKMLTDEAKNALINSSLKPRPATPEFLRIVADETNNPGRCSCGQLCPEEYQADLDCCARGTELAFTWLKTGHLEVCSLVGTS